MRTVQEGICDMQQKWYVASGYGNGKDADILLFTADASGKMEIEDAVIQGACPSFLCVADEKVFVASECSDKAIITSFRVEKGKLMPEKQIEFPGRGLCHLTAGKQVLYASCYQSGELYVIDHKLKYASRCYYGSSHIHGSVCVGEHELLAVDLGRNVVLKFDLRKGILANRLMQENAANCLMQENVADRLMQENAANRLMQENAANRGITQDGNSERSGQSDRCEGFPERIALREDSGPRQVLYDERSQKIIVINERGNSVAVGGREAWCRELTYRNATQTRGDVNYPGGASIDDNGRLFVANRGADTIAVFHITENLKFLGEWSCIGHWPRHLYCADDGLVFAACEKSNELRSFIWEADRLYPAEAVSLVRAACVTEVKTGCAD